VLRVSLSPSPLDHPLPGGSLLQLNYNTHDMTSYDPRKSCGWFSPGPPFGSGHGISSNPHKYRELLSHVWNIVQCLVPLLANAGLLCNAGHPPHWRRNVFWMLLAVIWHAVEDRSVTWTYYEV